MTDLFQGNREYGQILVLGHIYCHKQGLIKAVIFLLLSYKV